MSTSDKTLRLGGHKWLSWIGWLWSLALLFGLVFFVHKMNGARHGALDLGEDTFVWRMTLGASLVILFPITALSWMITGVWRVYKKQPDRWVPWMRLALLTVGVLCVSLLMPGPQQTANPITAETESIYLALASAAREQFSRTNNVNVIGRDSMIWLDPEHALYEPGRVPDSVRKRFDLMVPSCWPRYLLMIIVDDHCVVLCRGSSMLGMVGVRIYDKGPVVLYSDDDLEKNPYLPRQTRITDRLWFFTSD